MVGSDAEGSNTFKSESQFVSIAVDGFEMYDRPVIPQGMFVRIIIASSYVTLTVVLISLFCYTLHCHNPK